MDDEEQVLHEEENMDGLDQINDYIQSTLRKLDMVEKLKLLLTILNYGTKVSALILVILDFKEFSRDTLLLFSYLLYSLLEAVALAAAFLIIMVARIINILFKVPTFYLSNMICLPILYHIFRLCFIVTFFVQSITLIIFAEFSHFIYTLLLATSLLTILILEVLKLIMICGGKLGLKTNCFEIEFILQKVLKFRYHKVYQNLLNLFKAYEIIKYIYHNSSEIIANINPEVKKRIKQANTIREQYIELKEDYQWIKNHIITQKEEEKTMQ